MKKSLLILLSVTLVYGLWSCEDEVINDPTIPKKNFEMVWRKLVHSDTSTYLTLRYFFSNNYVVVGVPAIDPQRVPNGVMVLDRETGQMNSFWTDHWDQISTPPGLCLYDLWVGGPMNDYMVTNDGFRTCGYSVSSGNKLWDKPYSPFYAGKRISIVGNHAYVPITPVSPHSLTWFKLSRFDLITGQQEDLFTLNAEYENYKFFISPPTSYIANNQDVLLIGLINHLNFDTFHGIVWTYCYNLTQRKMQWIRKDFTEDIEQALVIPTVVQDRIVVHLMRGVACLDVETGATHWIKDKIRISLNLTDVLCEDGRVYCKTDDGIVYCWDLLTGAELWKQSKYKFHSNERSNFQIYQDKLLFNAYYEGRNHLICLSTSTGKVLWIDNEVLRNPMGRILIDKQKGYLYGSDFPDIFCIDLNKSN